jgi:hypothetical protein
MADASVHGHNIGIESSIAVPMNVCGESLEPRMRPRELACEARSLRSGAGAVAARVAVCIMCPARMSCVCAAIRNALHLSFLNEAACYTCLLLVSTGVRFDAHAAPTCCPHM